MQHRWWTNTLVSNWINSSWDVTSSNYLATYDDSGEWPMVAWSYSVTNYSAGQTEERQETVGLTSIARLATSGGTNGSALFCLTGTVKDLGLGVALPLTSGWTIASNAPDTSGRVFLILGNGTTNDATVKLDDSLTNSVTNWNYSVGAARVDLGMQWKGPNDTNWHSDWPLYVLKDTTVQFRVTTPGFTGVAWPTGYPQWSNGSNGVTQISMNFNSVSSDTNGQWVTVTAGTTASNQVVVFDYEVRFQPDAEGLFAGRATNTTRFGVGEGVNFKAVFNPVGLTAGNAGGIGWSVTGMSTEGHPDDRSVEPESSGSRFQAGAFVETNTVIATLLNGINASATRTNFFDVVRPTNAFLQSIILVWTNSLVSQTNEGHYFVPHTNIFHQANTYSCIKRASYFLSPRDVSFHGISVREGSGPYHYNGTNSPTNGFSVTATLPGGITNTWNFGAASAQHTPQEPASPSHYLTWPFGPAEANYWMLDHFGTSDPNPIPYTGSHTPSVVATLTGTIAIEIKRYSANYYHVCSVFSDRDFYSNGRLSIRKAGLGYFSKEYADLGSPE